MNMAFRPGPAPPDHPPVAVGRVGVLLVNLGSPDEPTVPAVRRYLAEFLSDRRVVELPALLWQPLLRGVILNTRPRNTAANYAKIWDRENNESPLRHITRMQTEKLAGRFGPQVEVDFAMRYGNPSIESRLKALKGRGCDRILIAPLYPQYSLATTGTVLAKANEVMAGWRWMPAVRTLEPYYDDPLHIDALARSLEASLANLDFEPDLLIASFHGMPERTLHLGDPYHCQCHKTARLLAERLGLPRERLHVTFQSRFGRAEWLKPYTDATLARLPGEGVKRVAIFSPGFSADCLETLEEIAMEGRETFLHAGGTHYAYLPCLNDGEVGMRMLHALVARSLSGWVPAEMLEAV